MKFWVGLKELERDIRRLSKRFMATCETLHNENGWYVARMYQKKVYELAVERMKENKIDKKDDLLCLAIEQVSFGHGERIYHEIMIEIANDKMIHNMQEN